MREEPVLSRNARAFIVLVALLQGGLMYLAQRGTELDWWPFSGLGGRICWYTLVLTVPTAMTLSVVELRDRRFWQHALALALLFLPLAAWAGWNATGAPGLESGAVLAPFGITLAIGLFVALPWLQCRLAHGHWRAAYPELFEHAWQNALTLALAALFTGICWAVLHLWGSLFALVKITFFRELFREDAFIYMATGAMAGLGILIGRTQHRPVQVARQILFAVFKGLLPLLAFIAVLFIASLPFTGLEPLWSTRSAAAILLSVVVLLVVFANAVYQDGEGPRPYPAWLRRMVEAGMLVLPLYALLALYAMFLRIQQYGWTSERFWAGLVAAIAAGYAFGYAWAVLRSRQAWLQPLRRVNMLLSWVVVGLAVLANSPLLDPLRLSASSQLERMQAAAPATVHRDLEHLRFELGRRGYLALQSLRDSPAFAGDADASAAIERMLKRGHRWRSELTDEARERQRLRDAGQLRQHIALASGTVADDDGWWQALLSGQLQPADCRLPDADCVALRSDLDADGSDEFLLCQIHDALRAQCQVHAYQANAWRNAGEVNFWSHDVWRHDPDDVRRTDAKQLRRKLLEGRIGLHRQRWPDLSLGDGEPQRIDAGQAASAATAPDPGTPASDVPAEALP